jgi:hypothetical protein
LSGVFISYRRTDLELAKVLADELRSAGVDVWYDANLVGGDDWRAAIVAAIQNVQVVVLLYSLEVEKSAEVAKELAVSAAEKKRIVPVRLADVTPSGAFLYEMARLNWVNAFPDPKQRLPEIALGLAEFLAAGAGDSAVDDFSRATGAHRIGEGALKRATRNNLALAVVFVAISALTFALYERETHFLATQAEAGAPALRSWMLGVAVTSLGAPVLLFTSVSRAADPAAWAIAVPAFVNTGVLLLLFRNWGRLVHLRLTTWFMIWRAGARPT